MTASQETGLMRETYGFQTGLGLGGRQVVGLATDLSAYLMLYFSF
jgi:hypothetical protein